MLYFIKYYGNGSIELMPRKGFAHIDPCNGNCRGVLRLGGGKLGVGGGGGYNNL